MNFTEINDHLKKLPYGILRLLAWKLGLDLHPCATQARVAMSVTEKLTE